MKIGKFIVIDGTDGSGKATQTKLLVERLKNDGHDVEIADFPQYGKKSAGLIEKYLNGKYGSAEEVGPYRASIFYACDRYDASFKIRKAVEEGKIVISNRYVTANMGHQGGKIKDPEERKKYFNWLYNLEYETFSIPRPDLNIILHVD
ncbi:MAG TPA: thymidylate kinase, partial [Candidatus Moranbacteria bacterium]|nr:thymidylate kinase [Candidatus Moranbacteria bacterium]